MDTIRLSDDTYCILLGDLIDAALANNKNDVYTATMNPGKSIQYVASILEPIKDKIIAAVDGNHEARICRAVSVSPTQLLMQSLGIPAAYCPTVARISVTLGYGMDDAGITFKIYGTHGNGCGHLAGSKLNALAKLGDIDDADVFFAGHTHLPAMFKLGHVVTDPVTGVETIAPRLFVNIGAALDYFGSYGETAGFPPSVIMMPVVELGIGTNGKKQIKGYI